MKIKLIILSTVVLALSSGYKAQCERVLIQSVYSEIEIKNDNGKIIESNKPFISSSVIAPELLKLWDNIKSGEINIYGGSYWGNELAEDRIGSLITDKEEIRARLNLISYEPKLDEHGDWIYADRTGDRVDEIVIDPILPADIIGFGFIEKWYLNANTNQLEKEIVAYTPIMNYLDLNGDIVGTKNLFFVKVNGEGKATVKCKVLSDVKVHTIHPNSDWFSQLETSSKATLISSVRDLANKSPTNLWRKDINDKQVKSSFKDAMFYESLEPLLDENGDETYDAITGNRLEGPMFESITFYHISKFRSHETLQINLETGLFTKSVTGVEFYNLKNLETGLEGKARVDESKFIYMYE